MSIHCRSGTNSKCLDNTFKLVYNVFTIHFGLFITGVGRKEEYKMPKNKWLAEEIVREAAKIPLESQKHILSVINAMVFTREAISREKIIKKDKSRP